MYYVKCLEDMPGDSAIKNPHANVGDEGSIPRQVRCPGEGNGNPLQYSLPGEFHGQRNLPGYSPGGCKRVGHNLVTKQQPQQNAWSITQ